MDYNVVPFLWNFIKSTEKSTGATGGEERFSESANEEVSSVIIKLE